jgi:hypothetical protein
MISPFRQKGKLEKKTTGLHFWLPFSREKVRRHHAISIKKMRVTPFTGAETARTPEIQLHKYTWTHRPDKQRHILPR